MIFTCEVEVVWYLLVRLRLCDIYPSGWGGVTFTYEFVWYCPWGWGCVMFIHEDEVMWYLPVRSCDIYPWGWGCVIFTCEVEVVLGKYHMTSQVNITWGWGLWYLPVRLRLCHIYLWGWGSMIFTHEVEVVWYLPMRFRLCDVYLWGWGCLIFTCEVQIVWCLLSWDD